METPEPAPARVPADGGAPDDRAVPADGGARVEANARLTATTAVVLLVLLAVEGFTILRIGPLFRLHVVLGMVLVPVVLLKMGSTLWRFTRYYLKDPAYRRRGPPPVAMRLLGPLVLVLTVVVFASGVALLIGPVSLRHQLLEVHRLSFIAWLAVMVVHVLGHIADVARLAPRDFYRRTRRQVHGAGLRQWLVLASAGVGIALVPLVLPAVTAWLGGAHG